MKSYKRILTVSLALLLTLSFAGCLTPKENDTNPTDAPTDTEATAAPVDTSDFDPDAIAVELGDILITAGEVNESFNYYMSMIESYYGSVPTDDASINEYRELAVSELIGYRVAEWKARSLGISLDAETEAQIEANAAAEIETLRNSLICDYAYYYAGADEVSDISELTDDQINTALEQIASELEMYFEEGYTLDRYLSDQHETIVEDLRVNALTDALKDAELADFALTEEQLDAWYEAALANQKESFDADPLEYRSHTEDYQAGTVSEPVLYVPDGFIKVQVIKVFPEAERDLSIDTNRAEMAALEAEYGALALNGEDEARQTEIRTQYLELKATNEELEELYLGEARGMINAAYEALEEDTPFETEMERLNSNGAMELLLYVSGEDSEYAELIKAAKDLPLGDYTEPLLIDDVYYIVKRVEAPAAGTVDRAGIADAIVSAATESERSKAWDELFSEWEKEAEQAAVRHDEAIAAIGYMN